MLSYPIGNKFTKHVWQFSLSSNNWRVYASRGVVGKLAAAVLARFCVSAAHCM